MKGNSVYANNKEYFEGLKESLRENNELHLDWRPTFENHLELGIYLYFYFTHNTKIFLRNKNSIEKVVDDQKNSGIPKSYEHALLLIDGFSRVSSHTKIEPLESDVYLIRPVRMTNTQVDDWCNMYCQHLEEQGLKVIDPKKSTDQNDPTGGYQIVRDHVREIVGAKRTDAYFEPASSGSYVDVGTFLTQHFIRDAEFRLLNREEMEKNYLFSGSDLGKLVFHLDDLRFQA